MERREGDRQLAIEVADRRTGLEDAAESLQEIIELLDRHGPATSNTGLRSLAAMARAALAENEDVAEVALEIRRLMRSGSRAFTDIVVHSDDDDERIRLNTAFESMKARLHDGLRRASE